MTLPKDPEYYTYLDDGDLAWVGCGIIILAMLATIAGIVLVVWVAM